MASIYLMRHGQASFGADDYDQLSELGQQQATLLGGSLVAKMPRPDKVVCGTMLRHRQTADASLRAFGADDVPEIISDANWNEYDHQQMLGALDERLLTPTGVKAFLANESNPKQAFEKVYIKAVSRWMSGDYDGDYVEPWQQFKDRVLKGLQQVVNASEDCKHVLVYTSGGPISLIAQSLLGAPEPQMMHINWTLVNCGITKLVTRSRGPFISTLNEHTVFEGEDKRGLVTYK